MNISGSRILITGAAGGIGRCIALELARRGATLALAGRSVAALEALAGDIRRLGGEAVVLAADLALDSGHERVVREAIDGLGGLDVLVNNAGMSHFQRYQDTDTADIRRTLAVNVTAPMLLAHAVLPLFTRQGRGHIVNVGSAFGTLAFPYFAAYSASKFALRGFSEALRRELHGSGVRVLYVAPRATATAMNGPGVRAMYAETRTAMDAPERVASVVVNALERGRSEVYIGWPERFFVRLNALLPRLVDRALTGQNRLAARHARAAAPRNPE